MDEPSFAPSILPNTRRNVGSRGEDVSVTNRAQRIGWAVSPRVVRDLPWTLSQLAAIAESFICVGVRRFHESTAGFKASWRVG